MTSRSNSRSSAAARRAAPSPSASERSERTGRYIPSRADVYDSVPSTGTGRSSTSPGSPVVRVYSSPAPRSARTARSIDGLASDEAFDEIWGAPAFGEADRRERNGRNGRNGRYAPDSDEPDEPDFDAREARAEARKRSRSKAKAERRYRKQYGAADAAAADAAGADAGPRAAVYTGRMGAKQRQATRMQRDEAQPAARRGGRARAAGRRRALPIVATVFACLLFACAFLYPAAKQYYTALRTNDQLQAEYDALLERNELLSDEIDVLSSDSGVEQAAREELGWVMDGETSGAVEGLEQVAEEDVGTIPASISSGSVEMPSTWYSAVLDPIFGVE